MQTEVKINKALLKSDCFRVAFIGFWSLAFSVILVHSQVTFNPTVEVTLGGSQPGSVIAGGTMPQIIRTTTFFFNLQDDLPSSRTMSFDTGVLNMNALTRGTRLETNIVISTARFGAVATARVGHTIVRLTPESATLAGTVEAITIDPGVASLLRSRVTQVIEELIGFVGMNSSISANAEGFSYIDLFNVPGETVSEDIQSFQIEAVVTDTFPVDLYSTPQLGGTLTVSNDLTSLTGLTSGPILDQFIVSGSAPGDCELPLGHPDYCRGCGPCGEGVGDCDSDSQCESGLSCVDDVGANYGFAGNVDVCEACRWPLGHPNYCTDCGPCGVGVGDCDGDAQCESGLSCVDDVGANYGFVANIDVCESVSSCPWPLGHANYCLDCGPCGVGVGDCDGDAQCESGLSCVDDVGANYGFVANIDVCEAPAGQGPHIVEVLVDCDNGDSINDALKTPAVHLTVRIKGFCDESVVISHLSNITLVGDSGDPTQDGIRGAAADGELPSFGNVLYVEHSTRVEIIDLTLRDGNRNGIGTSNGNFRLIDNCRLLDNANNGISLNDSRVGTIQDTTISGNRGVKGGGAKIEGGTGINTRFSRFTCRRCTIEDNPNSAEGIAMFLRESTVVVEDSDLQGLVTVLAGPNSDVIVRESTLNGVWQVKQKSILRLRSVTQLSPGGFNSVFEDSLLTSTDGPVLEGPTMLVDTHLHDFSKAIISGWDLDNLICEDLSDAICDGTETKTSSTCASCP